MGETDKSAKFEKALAELERETQKLGKPFDKEKALRDIQEAVWLSARANEWAKRDVSPAYHRDFYKGLLNAVSHARKGCQELINKPVLLGPIECVVGEWYAANATRPGDPDWVMPGEIEEWVLEIGDVLKRHEAILRKASQKAAEAVGGKGRRKGKPLYAGLDTLIKRLIRAWETQTQKDIGVARPTYAPEEPSSGDFDPYGPFINFVESVVMAAELEVGSSNIPEYINTILRRRRRDLDALLFAREKRTKGLMDKFGAIDI